MPRTSPHGPRMGNKYGFQPPRQRGHTHSKVKIIYLGSLQHLKLSCVVTVLTEPNHLLGQRVMNKIAVFGIQTARTGSLFSEMEMSLSQLCVPWCNLTWSTWTILPPHPAPHQMKSRSTYTALWQWTEVQCWAEEYWGLESLLACSWPSSCLP